MLTLFGNQRPIPDKIVKKIFHLLPTSILATTARLVSRSWKNYIDKTFPKHISIYRSMPTFFSAPEHSLVYVHRLTGGMTNVTSKIKTRDGSKYIARQPGKDSESFIDRQSEYINSLIAYKAGIAPNISFNNAAGARISDYLHQPLMMSPRSLKHRANLIRATRAMQLIHTSGKRFANDVDVFDRNRVMLEILAKNKFILPAIYDEITQAINAIEQYIKYREIATAPCHNDTTPGNFIFSNGKMWLIDWEYSGNNDPLWDLANLSMEAEFTDEQDALMLDAYYGYRDQDILTRFTLYKPVVEYWASLWALVQISNRNHADSLESLEQLERKRLGNCVSMLKAPLVNTPH